MGFWKSLFKKKVEIKEVPIDPESMRESQLVKALSYTHAEDIATIAKLKKEVAEIREREKDIKEEENVKVVLDEKKKELIARSQGKFFSLNNFYEKYYKNKKFRNKLGYYSFDRSHRFGDFGDWGFMENGDFAVLDKKIKLLIRMPNTKDIFQSVSALGVDIDSGKIPLWLDKEGGYIENIMEYEAPELLSTGEKLKFAKARKRPVYEIITSLNNEISDLRSDLAESEMMVTSLQNKVDKLESEQGVHENMAETSRAELKINEDRLTGIDRTYRELGRDMLKFHKLNEIQEDSINKLESIKDSLMKESEKAGSTTSFDDAIQKIDSIKDILKERTLRAHMIENPPIK